jgi:dTDP-4-dehydrorhamnose 3,5-epimerase
MVFEELPLAGAYLILPARKEDERGYFVRTYCRDTFLDRGLEDCSVQCSVSFNRSRGTLRGMHFQRNPHQETKLVRCSRGAIYDVIVDLRPGSPTFARWHGAELNEQNGRALYVPRGFAHGFITLCDAAEVTYQMADRFVPGAAAGVRWDDPDLAIRWPTAPTLMSLADNKLPLLKDLVLV